jgi:hypothetical protein
MMKNYAVLLLVFLILSLSHGMNQTVSAQVTEQDSLAIVALYDSTEGVNWTNNNNWLTGQPVSTWHGITVSNGRIAGIDLWANNLVGSIPPEIGNLTNLTDLKLLGNQLSGAIPTEIGNLTNLTDLSLLDNQLSGAIPTEIGNLTNLTNLYLFDNQLSGAIPTEIGNLTNLEWLGLGTNQLSGAIPTEIGNLANLIILHLTSNQLSGAIPTEIGNLTNLTDLYLLGNQLSGAIPTEISNLTNLTNLHLSENQFVNLPDLSSITTLDDLQIQNNKFTFEDIEPNIGFATFFYAPQDSVGIRQDTTVTAGSSFTVSVDVGGANNQYLWLKDGIPISEATNSSFTISSVDASDAGSYTCKITNTAATELILYSRPINVTTTVAVGISDNPSQMPKAFALYQNYPNPFNPTTEIKYQIPFPSHVQLAVYNIQGQLIRELVNEEISAGYHTTTWHGRDTLGNGVGSGIYFYRIEARGAGSSHFVETRKMLLMK